MNFSRIFLFAFACLVALCAVSAAPEPRWKVFKKIVSILIVVFRPILYNLHLKLILLYQEKDTYYCVGGSIPNLRPPH